MRLGSVQQRPSERISYSILYGAALDEGDSVAAIISLTSTPEGLDISQLVGEDNRIRLLVSGGVMGVSYVITTLVLTANGEILEDELTVKVK